MLVVLAKPWGGPLGEPGRSLSAALPCTPLPRPLPSQPHLALPCHASPPVVQATTAMRTWWVLVVRGMLVMLGALGVLWFL